MKYELKKEDLENSLKTQIKFLETSCKLYDKGSIEECLRIAQTLRVLLHDTSNSISLLKQIGIKYSMKFHSTHNADQISEKWISSLTTTFIGIDVAKSVLTESIIIPRKETSTKKNDLDFDEWWKGQNVLVFKTEDWTRKDLVLAASNKLGGAHVDPNPEENLLIMNQETGIFYTAMNSNKPVPARKLDGDQFSASIRQIGFEFLKSINEIY